VGQTTVEIRLEIYPKWTHHSGEIPGQSHPERKLYAHKDRAEQLKNCQFKSRV